MPRQMLTRIRIPWHVLVSTVALLSVAVFSTMAQQGNRVMKKTVTPPNQPIQLKEVRVDGNLVSFEQPFDAPADSWAETMTVVARNTSSKTITAIKIVILFPTGPKSHVGFTLRYEGEAQPNTEITLSGTPQHHKLMPFLAERGEVPDFSKAIMVVDQVFFGDDTLWIQGTVFRKNAKTGGWDVISTPSGPVGTTKHHASFGRSKVWPNAGRPSQTCVSTETYQACTGQPPERHCQAVTVSSTYGIPGWYDSAMVSEDCPGSACGAFAHNFPLFDPDCQPLP